MEKGTTKSFDTMREAFKQLSSMSGPSASAVASFRTLSQAIGSFKGPSAASVANARALVDLLRSVAGVRIGGVAGINALFSSFAGFKGPSAAAAANSRNLLRALSGFSAPRVSGSFTSFLSSLANFRGPPPTAGRNTTSLLNALSSFKAPGNLRNAAAEFTALANAIQRASTAMSSLNNSSKRGISTPTVKSGSIKAATADLGGFETAILRTQTALNALGGVLGIKFLAEASNNIIKIKAQMEAATGSLQQGRVQFQFVREEADKLGLEFVTTAKSYGMLLGSIKGTNVTFDEAQTIFKGFSTAARALQLSTDDVDGVFRALGQMLSKGKLQAEELRGQLGDRLPGAFVRFAKALDMTKPGELDNALKKGAISGDKLKNAILSVAQTMEGEFAVSADKASKTVDSAFNRLKNSFTFAAGDFGQNGFNQALIALADSLKKFLESDALNSAMKKVAQLLKFLGDNIEVVASIAAGFAFASFAKWALGVLEAAKALTTLSVVMKLIDAAALGRTALAAALGLGTMGTAASGAAIAMGVLRTVMMTMGWGLLIAAVSALVYWMSTYTSKVDEANKVIAEHTKDTSELQNIYDAYRAKIFDATTALDGEIKKTRELTLARLEAAQAALGNAKKVRYTSRAQEYAKGLTGQDAGWAYFTGSQEDKANKDVIPQSEAGYIRPLTSKGLPVSIHTDQDAVNLAKALARADTARSITPFSDPAEAAFQAAQARYNIYRQQQKILGNKNLDKMLGEAFGDYNKSTQTGGLSGTAAPNASKKKKGNNSFENDLDRAKRAFDDLDRKIKGTRDTLLGFLDSSSSALAAQARATAVDKVADIENAFDPKKRVAGILATAKAMGVEASSYEKAKAALIDKYATQAEAQERAKNDLSVGKTIAELREENDIRAKYINQIAEGGQAMSEANMKMEVEKQLIGTSVENHALLTKALTDQLTAQHKLNEAQDIANAMSDVRSSTRTNTAVVGAMGSGILPEDLDRYKELLSYVNDLRSKGYDAGVVEYLTELKQAEQAQDAALKRLEDQYENIRQMSQDMADAIVGSLKDVFENGYKDGETFFKRIGSLFKSLGTTILDAAFFNPLKQYLTNMFTTNFSKGLNKTPEAQAFETATADVKSILNTGQDMVQELQQQAKDLTQSSTDLTASATNLNTSADNLNAAANAIKTAAGGGSPLDSAVSVTNGSNPQAVVNSLGGQAGIGAITSVALGTPAFKSTLDTANEQAGKNTNDIVVTGIRGIEKITPPEPVKIEQKNPLQGVKNIYDYKANQSTLKDGLSQIGSIFGKNSAKTGDTLSNISQGLGKVAQVAGTAIAAYQMGSGIAKALGLGRGGERIVGGASAGYAIAGPYGAIAGAVIGGISALFLKPAYANAKVSVGADGRAVASQGVKSGQGDLKAAQDAAKGGASVFTQFADQLGAYLTIGDYGTFGNAKLPGKGTNQFYSISGAVNKKGQPTGVKGVDWIEGTPEELQAFALKAQIKAGKFGDLDPIYKTIAQNSTATTLSDFTNDLNVGKTYNDFIDQAKVQSDLQKQVDALNKSYKSLSRSAGLLGLDTGRLEKAYKKLLQTQKTAFNKDINQQILQIKDPLLASYNALMDDYENAVGNAVAVGGDLAAVEQLYGLKRKQIVEDYQKQINDTISGGAKELLNQLTATTASPLSPLTTFNNAKTTFETLKTAIQGGDYSNVDKLQEYAQNYLDTGRTISRSSADYFAIFNEVTDFLKTLGDSNIGIGPTNADNLPALPGVQEIVDKLAHQNDDLLESTNSVGVAIIDGNNTQEQLLTNIRDLLQQVAQTGDLGLLSNTGLAYKTGTQ